MLPGPFPAISHRCTFNLTYSYNCSINIWWDGKAKIDNQWARYCGRAIQIWIQIQSMGGLFKFEFRFNQWAGLICNPEIWKFQMQRAKNGSILRLPPGSFHDVSFVQFIAKQFVQFYSIESVSMGLVNSYSFTEINLFLGFSADNATVSLHLRTLFLYGLLLFTSLFRYIFPTKPKLGFDSKPYEKALTMADNWAEEALTDISPESGFLYSSTTISQFIEYYNTQASQYSGGKVLVSFSSAPGAGGLLPVNGFFDACRMLKQNGELEGIFVWCADWSKATGFKYEIESQDLLASWLLLVINHQSDVLGWNLRFPWNHRAPNRKRIHIWISFAL